MFFKFSILWLFVILFNEGLVSSEPTAEQVLDRLLTKLLKRERDSNPLKTWDSDELTSSATGDSQRVKPLAAPPPAPALGDIVMPVAWPYPPAPQSNSEFPLLEKFMRESNGLGGNQISYNNQYVDTSRPEANPKPVVNSQPDVVTESPKLPWNQWFDTRLEVNTPIPIAPTLPKQVLTTPSPPLYSEWAPRKPVAQQAPGLVQNQYIPPPLNPDDHFYIQHNPQTRGQNKQFSLQALRLPEPQVNRNEKLNVSFVLPPDIRPLTLNFDTGDVQVDFGDEKGKPVPLKTYKTGNALLEQIFGSQNTGSAAPVAHSGSAQPTAVGHTDSLSTGILTSNERTPIENDDDYIVVRHDMNKYAYDVPKGLPLNSGFTVDNNKPLTAQTSLNGNTGSQTLKEETFDVSGKKNLHFTLGRVVG